MKKEQEKHPPRAQTTPNRSFELFLLIITCHTLSLPCINSIIWITTWVGNKIYIGIRKHEKKETLNLSPKAPNNVSGVIWALSRRRCSPTQSPCNVLCRLQPVYTIKHTIVSKNAKKKI